MDDNKTVYEMNDEPGTATIYPEHDDVPAESGTDTIHPEHDDVVATVTPVAGQGELDRLVHRGLDVLQANHAQEMEALRDMGRGIERMVMPSAQALGMCLEARAEIMRAQANKINAEAELERAKAAVEHAKAEAIIQESAQA